MLVTWFIRAYSDHVDQQYQIHSALSTFGYTALLLHVSWNTCFKLCYDNLGMSVKQECESLLFNYIDQRNHTLKPRQTKQN